MRKVQRKVSKSSISFAVVIVFVIVVFTLYLMNQALDSNQQSSSEMERLKLRIRAEVLLKDIEKYNNILTNLVPQRDIDSINISTKSAILSTSSSPTIGSTSVRAIELNNTTRISSSSSSLHPILFMDENEFLTTPLSLMMSSYGEADGGGSCADDFGNQLVNRWRNTKKRNCEPKDLHSISDPDKVTSTSIDCYLVKQTRHHGYGDNLCLMKDVSIDLGVFAEDQITTPVVKTYVASKHFQQPYIKFNKGFVAGNCSVDNMYWIPNSMPGWNVDWTFNALETSDTKIDKLVCHERVDHNVLIVQRDTFANFFHDSEDFFNVFLAMAILEWNLQDTQIYLTDLYPQGPFWEMWSKVFGHGRSPMTSWDLRNKFKKLDSEAKSRTCFNNIAIGIYGPAAPVTVASWDTSCSRTALVRAYSDFVIRSLGIQQLTRYYEPSPRKTLNITFMARRASVEWPEKKFCSNNSSFFKCDYWKDFGIRSLGRMIRNEDDLLKGLKRLENESYQNGLQVIVNDVDYNLLSLEDQIKHDLDTDIMIGPHGAGLMHNIFMPDRSALIELFVDGSAGNRHFHNLANWYGRTYKGIASRNPVDVDGIIVIVRDIIQQTNLNKY